LPDGISFAQPARRPDGIRSTFGPSPSYAFSAGTAVA
jgi:hypothetical protein